MMKGKLILVLFFFVSHLGFGQIGKTIGEKLTSEEVQIFDIEVNMGTPYVAYAVNSDNKHIHLIKFVNEAWEEILIPEGADVGGVLDLLFYKNTPYILYEGYSGLNLISYKDGVWHKEGKSDFASDPESYSVYDPKYIIVEDIPYIIYENKVTDRIDMHMLVKKDNIHIWSSLDAIDKIPEGSEQPGICTNLNNEIFLSWFDRENDKIGFSKITSDGEELEDMSKGIPSKSVSNLLGVKSIGNDLFLAFENSDQDYNVSIMKYNSDKKKWEILDLGLAVNAKMFNLNDNMSIVNLNENKQASFHEYVGTYNASEAISIGESEDVKSCSNGNKVYVAYSNMANGGVLVVKEL